jgi:hypothetical protein
MLGMIRTEEEVSLAASWLSSPELHIDSVASDGVRYTDESSSHTDTRRHGGDHEHQIRLR